MSGRTSVRSSESQRPCAALALTSASLSRRQARSTAVKSSSILSSASSIMRSTSSRLRSSGAFANADITSSTPALESPESWVKSVCLMGPSGLPRSSTTRSRVI